MYNSSKRTIIILTVLNIILTIALVGTITYILINASKSDTQGNVLPDVDRREPNNQIPNDNTNQPTTKQEIETFNSQFTSYEGNNITPTQVKSLMEVVSKSNNNNKEHLIILDSQGTTTVEQINNEKKYTVELSKDEAGYVNKIKITEQTDTLNNGGQTNIPDNNGQTTIGNMEVLLFNAKFNSYLGNITGEKLKTLLQVCQESVNTNPEHSIQVTSNNVASLNDIVEADTYTVTFSYDANGYINKINFDKKI